MFQCMGACLFHFVMKTLFVDIFFSKRNLNCPLDILSLLLRLSFCSTGPVLVWKKCKWAKQQLAPGHLNLNKHGIFKLTIWPNHVWFQNRFCHHDTSEMLLSKSHVWKKGKTKIKRRWDIHANFFPLKNPNTLENTKTNEAQKQRQIMCVYVFLIPWRG